MIKATELRIGNLLQYENEVAPVNAIWSNGNFELHSDVLQFWTIEAGDELVTGIPLSPEWLERFGFGTFEYGENTLYIDKRPYTGYINHWVRGFLNVNGYFCLLGHDDRHLNIAFVHQLQNLYFALTGEELTLKS